MIALALAVRSSRLGQKLLKQQEENAAELKRLQGEITGAKSHKSQQPRGVDPEFPFAGNKKQYFLNRYVVDKIDEALEADDNEERMRKLTEDKELLVERNKQSPLAEKYGCCLLLLPIRLPATQMTKRKFVKL